MFFKVTKLGGRPLISPPSKAFTITMTLETEDVVIAFVLEKFYELLQSQ
jgi:hypothetical protein